jgi:hypothetical protein
MRARSAGELPRALREDPTHWRPLAFRRRSFRNRIVLAALPTLILHTISLAASEEGSDPTSEIHDSAVSSGTVGIEPPPDSPFHGKIIAGDADPLGEGAWQIQLNSIFRRSRARWDEERRHSSTAGSREREGGLSIAYGLTDEIDLGVGLGFGWFGSGDAGATGSGPADLDLSAKWRVLADEQRGLWIAYVPTVSIPSERSADPEGRDPGKEGWRIGNRLCIVTDLPGSLSLNADFGFRASLDSVEGSERTGMDLILAVGRQVNRRLQPEIEIMYDHSFLLRDADQFRVSAVAGLVAMLSDRFDLRLGIQQDLAGRSSERSTGMLVALDVNFLPGVTAPETRW